MGSLWPKATTAWAGLAQLASTATRPLTAHGTRGAAKAWSARARRAVTMRGRGQRARCGAVLTGDPIVMRFTVCPTPWLKLHAATLTPRWKWWEVGPH
jgi:hypothetical protein